MNIMVASYSDLTSVANVKHKDHSMFVKLIRTHLDDKRLVSLKQRAIEAAMADHQKTEQDKKTSMFSRLLG
jgi:hypothetical protein